MTASGKSWTAFHADTVDVAKAMPSTSVDFSIFSLPFSSLFVYSNSPRDFGNVRNDEEFFQHYSWLVREQFRVMKPGRLLSVHCMDLPTSKERDGYIGIRDFRGAIIHSYESCQLEVPCDKSKQKLGPNAIRCDHSFINHSSVTIWKDPVTAVARTHALGLLYKQLRKDSCMSRQGIADYIVTVRKPGENPEPVTKTHEGFPVERWQKYASPVWMDIDQSDTLQYKSAREHDDERHLCPLQLPVIRRCIELWSNPNDVVWSPFMGIGSEGVCALELGRRFIGAELKESYFKQAVMNLTEAENHQQLSLEALFTEAK